MTKSDKDSNEFSGKKPSNLQLFLQYGKQADLFFGKKKFKECKGQVLTLLSLVDGRKEFPHNDIARYLYYLTCINYAENDLEKALLQAQINSIHFEELNNTEYLTRSLTLEGAIYFRLAKYKDCIEKSEAALILCDKHKQDILAGKVSNNLAAVYFELGYYFKAVSCYHRSLDICEAHQLYQDTPVIFYNMINSLLHQERFVLAGIEIDSFKKKIEKYELGEEASLWHTAALCDYYNKQKKYDLLLNRVNAILPKTRVSMSSQMAERFNEYKIESLIEIGEYQKAFTFIINSLIDKRFNKKPLNIYVFLGRLIVENPERPYLAHPVLKEFNGSVLKLLKKTEYLVKKSDKLRAHLEVYELMTKAYESLGQYKKAYLYLKKVLKTKEGIYQRYKEMEIFKLQEEYQSKQKEQEIIFQQKLIEEQKEINEKLEAFAQVTAHDLKEPLRGIYSFSQILKDKTYEQLGVKEREYWDFIIEASLRMERLIKDILTFSKMGTNLPKAEMVDLNDLLNKVLQNLSARIKMVKGKVLFPKLPTILGHDVLFLQLFQNLIGNALKFRKEEESPIVEVRFEKQETNYLFSVIDNGIGIPEEKVERVFDAFIRLHKRSKFEGSGLGLATCKKIVETYEGEIGVESVLNKGTTFYFTIPIIE